MCIRDSLYYYYKLQLLGWSPDGKFFAFAYFDGIEKKATINFWSPRTKQLRSYSVINPSLDFEYIYVDRDMAISDFAWSPQKNQLAMAVKLRQTTKLMLLS